MAKARILDDYVCPAIGLWGSRLIGGRLGVRILETQLHKKGLDYQLAASGDLCVLSNTFARTSLHCLAVDSSAADALMIQL